MQKAHENDLSAFNSICDLLQPFDDETRSRIVKSIVMFFDIDFQLGSTFNLPSGITRGNSTEEMSLNNSSLYSTFAEVYAAAKPSTNADKALVAGFWLQTCQGNLEGFKSQDANEELANLGYKINNITDALSKLIGTDPQLVLQTKKSGKTRQARKTYKLTRAGVDRVRDMIDE